MPGKPTDTPEIPEPPQARFCLAVLLNAQDEVLLVRRSRSDDFAPGLWGLPGGHIREGEEPEGAMRRELREELGEGLSLRPLHRAGPMRDTLYGGVFEVHLFLFRCEGGAVRLDPEHEEHAWVTREAYRTYAVVDGIDEDFLYLDVWPGKWLNAGKLPRMSRD